MKKSHPVEVALLLVRKMRSRAGPAGSTRPYPTTEIPRELRQRIVALAARAKPVGWGTASMYIRPTPSRWQDGFRHLLRAPG